MSKLTQSTAPRPPLARDLTIVILLKVAIVVAAALFVFSPAQRPKVDAARVESRLMGFPTDSPSPRTTAP